MRSLRAVGGNTVVWAENLSTGEMYHLLRWGNNVYLPVEAGDHIGIGVYNDSPYWKAYPAFVEALNIWEDGQSEPENCDPNHMWEVSSYERLLIDALMNPNGQSGRPLIITRSGEGFGIGESTFGTTAYRGQIRIYERNQQYRPAHSYGAQHPGQLHVPEGPYRNTEAQTLGGTRETVRTRGSFKTEQEETPRTDRGSAAIGVGAEEHRSHYQTGINYVRASELVMSFQVEFRKDLQPMLNRAWGKQWSWFWPRPHEARWFDAPWTWQSPRHRTSPQIPIIQPHIGR